MVGNFTKKIYKLFSERLANKLALIFSLTVSIFIIALIMISYFRTSDILTNEFIENNKSILKLVDESLDNYIQTIDEFSLTLRKAEGNKLLNILIDAKTDFQSNKFIEDQIQNLFNSRQDIEKVSFYMPNKNTNLYISRSMAIVRSEQYVDKRDTIWYKNATVGRYYRYIEPELKVNNAKSNNEKLFFTFHRALINISDQKTLGVISISFNHSMMKKINWNEYSQEGEVLLIYDKEKQLFYSSDSDLADSGDINSLMNFAGENTQNGSFRTKINQNDYLVVYSTSEDIGWRTAKLIPIDVLNKKVRQTRNISLFLGIVFILLFVIIIILISNIITGSLQSLSRHMEKVGKGNFKTKSVIKGNDETAQLSRTFNFMVEQIDELVNEKYLAKLNERTAQLKALEAQINPHFLYNSLQAIASKAVLSGNKDISRMIEALAYNLRYCIKGGDMVRVSDEINHINNYLILHKARFEDRLSVEIIVEDGTPDIMIPKLSIHTLVENSIKHSLEEITGSILIRIHSYTEDDRIIIKVTDDGHGMTHERLEEIRNELENYKWFESFDESIGLKNLYGRLKLMYGNNAELLIKSTLNQGTEIRIILPMNNQGDGVNV